jgi:hypothetical protein
VPTTITNLALTTKVGHDPGNPMFCHVVEFDLKADYDPAAPLLITALAAVLDAGKTVIAVIPINCRGLELSYVVATGAIRFYWCDNNAVGNGALIEVPQMSLAAYTDMQLALISQ